MSVQGSMFAGVSGLKAQSQRLATISENIANVSTTGYKRMDTRFSTFVTESTTTRHSPGGVQSRPTHEIDMQGLLQATLSETDLAISGQGFFVVNQNAIPSVGDQYLYTRAGSFQADAQGFMKNTAGYYLQGWPLDPTGNLPTDNSSLISLESVNIGQVTGQPSATSLIDIGQNLPAASSLNATGDGTIPDAVRSSDVVVFDSLGISQTLRLNWNHVANNEWRLVINPGSSSGGANSINGVQFDDDTAVGTNALTDAETQAVVTNGEYLTVTFNTDGTLADIVDVSTGNSVIDLDTGYVEIEFNFTNSGAANSQMISFNFGTPGQANGLAQYDADFFTSFINQNGVRFGSFTGVNINESGLVTAIFDNGQTQPLYQIPLVTFANPNGLEPKTGNAYAQTERAGEFILRVAGQAGTGEVIASSLENSTVDIADEFSNMILTQRAYSANTRIIKTADEMIAELIQVTG
jgi:flagellar hook protein FlgE